MNYFTTPAETLRKFEISFLFILKYPVIIPGPVLEVTHLEEEDHHQREDQILEGGLEGNINCVHDDSRIS